MNLKKCIKGHFYDADKSSSCPLCGEQELVQEDDTTVYLKKIGLLDCAEQSYNVLVRLVDGRFFNIPVIGRQKSDDVIKKMIDDGVLNADKIYRFRDWPKANSIIGSRCEYQNACVCELDVNKIYNLESCDMDDVRRLYGCPWCKSVDYGSAFERIKAEESIKEKLLFYYPEMKGIQISCKNSSVAKLLFTPEATEELLAFMGWGRLGYYNCLEHIAGLNGFVSGKLIVIEKIVQKKEPEKFDRFIKLSENGSLRGIAYTHPFELSYQISTNDVLLNSQSQYNNTDLISLIINPKKKQIAAYRSWDFVQLDVEFLVKNSYELNNFFSAES